MIYVILTYFFSPLIYFLTAARKKKSISRILIIQTAKIGDLICSTPVFREVKKQYPYAYITVIASPASKELLEYNPNINDVITINNADHKGFLGKLRVSNLIRRGKYDIGICLNPNIPFAVALFWGLVPIRLSVMPDFSGVTFKLASVFFTYCAKHVKGKMVIETYMQILKAIGISSNDISKEIYKSKDADAKAEQITGKIDKPLIGIAVSSGNKLKELGVDKIADIINMILNELDAYIVLIGSRQDTDAANTILRTIEKKDRVINSSGRLHLKELPALIERLSLFVGVDSGITYMADALSIPLIDIAGPSDMKDQRPTGKNAMIIQRTKIPCVPCSHTFKSPYYCKINTKECVETITVGDILKAVKMFPLPHKE